MTYYAPDVFTVAVAGVVVAVSLLGHPVYC